MARKIARFINLMLCGMLTGNEFGSIVAVHPAVASLPPPENIRAEQAITARYGKIMPVFMVMTAISFIPVLSLDRGRPSPGFRFSLAGLICYVVMIIVSLAGNVPINRATLETPADPGRTEDFTAMRGRWNRLHLLRNALNLTGLSCVIVANLRERG